MIAGPSSREAWSAVFQATRDETLRLAHGLSVEDQQVQSMPDVSPTKWHLAHTTWFFETFLLADSPPFDPNFCYLFNSYYEAVGERLPRPARGLLSRPSLAEIHAYRAHVDAEMARLIAQCAPGRWAETARVLELGIHHEQQHQELILMDIKHVFSVNPLAPVFCQAAAPASIEAGGEDWLSFEGGLIEIGAAANGGFAFDNEGPRHRVWLEPFRLQDRLVTAGEWAAFMQDDGYRRPELWLSDGWALAGAEGWRAPLYWRRRDGAWRIFTLHGERPVDPAEPVCHVSFYEADAYARWRGMRLPTEAEWEVAAGTCRLDEAAEGALHPRPAAPGEGLRQMAGAAWQWTASPYVAYPGYRPAAGALGEYNGKFMSNQMVLRGGACVTPKGHTRPTYRNFFPPAARWPFAGVRLADHA